MNLTFQLGALLPEKCKALGVPKGPLLGQLKNGQDVTLSCGKVVKASEVTTPSDPGPVFIGNFLKFLRI